jgi:hypothetical protein
METRDEAAHEAGAQDSTIHEPEEKKRTSDEISGACSVTREKQLLGYRESALELHKQAAAYYHSLSSGVTLAATVILGFIFNGVHGSGAWSVVREGERIALERAWGTGILSILFGFMYIAASSAVFSNNGFALGRIADEMEPSKPQVGKPLSRFRRGSRVYRAIGRVAILLQVATFGAALLFLTRAMWAY